MSPLAWIGLALVALWAVAWIGFKIVSGLVHAYVVICIVLIIWGLLKTGARAVTGGDGG